MKQMDKKHPNQMSNRKQRPKSAIFADLSKDIQQLQSQIYQLEGTYLQSTKQYGNIVIGFNSYIFNKSINTHKNCKLASVDRLFSLSSSTSKASQSYNNEKVLAISSQDLSKQISYRKTSSRNRGKMPQESQNSVNNESVSVVDQEQSIEMSFQDDSLVSEQHLAMRINSKKKHISKINQKSKNTKNK